MVRSGINNTILAILIGNILMLVSGISISWPSPEIEKFMDSSTNPLKINFSANEVTWIISFLPLGATFGPFLFGLLADIVGRKNTLLFLGIPYLVAYLMLTYGKHLTFYYLARFLCGATLGGVFSIIPLYIGEIADKSNRGILSSTMNISVCFGILFSYSVGPFISITTFNLLIATFPAIFLVLFSFLGEETPYFYMSRNREHKSKIVLEKFRDTSIEETNRELQEIKSEIRDNAGGRLTDIFKCRGLANAFIIAMGLLIFQQMSGMNIVMFYSQQIFYETGVDWPPEYCPIIVGLVYFLSTFVCPLIIDRCGRKTCLLLSGAGVTASLTILGVYCIIQQHVYKNESITAIIEHFNMLPLITIIVFLIAFNTGFGPVPYIILGELFPTNIKSIASSVLISLSWLLSFFVTMYFGLVMETVGIGPLFLVFALFSFCAVLFNQFFVIETKGKSLEEIQDILKCR